MKYRDLPVILRKKAPVLFFSALTLKQIKGSKTEKYANEILSFLDYKYADYMERYISRVDELNKMQIRFIKTGKYPSSKYSEVEDIDKEDYNIALLLSFILTVHRFGILEKLVDFMRKDSSGPKELLSIGAGAGYEIKLANEILTDWELKAYENSKEHLDYAKDFLKFFNCPSDSLIYETFPLEAKDIDEVLKNRFGKIVMCEVIEHLEKPVQAIRNLKSALNPEGEIFLTFAINIAQEDHIYLYTSIEQAREQVRKAGLRIVDELICPVAIRPFKEEEAEKIFEKGNYICICRK
jgi:2-polyprenyl-3-methyl-5-hydroxy-6-metoxy-1,4-benzoquinol methylase